MIPRQDIDVVQDLKVEALHTPGPGTVGYPAWLGTQRDYDAEFYGGCTWLAAQQALDDERAALSQITADAADEAAFDELAYEDFEVDAPSRGYLELGVTALCIALNAAGCVTASSCRGHPGGPLQPPQVLLACDRTRGLLLSKLCRAAGCGISNFETTGAVIYAPSVGEFTELAQVLLDNRLRFEALPPGPPRSGSGSAP